MRYFRAGLMAAAFLALASPAAADDMGRWKAQAARISIVRDDWGIAHVHGKTDADAVFWMGCAQADDAFPFKYPSRSNGFAIAPSIPKAGPALLLINPHTSFFFRSDLQMTSDEGLNAYGAATWGQIFIYQGFNEHAGWMHTTSGADT